MKFKKMHGLGNDFVIFDARDENLFITPDDMALIADRHWGVGCDTIVVLDKSEKADVFAYFFNADGSESGACGNATRCVADMVMAESGKDKCDIEVTYGVLACEKKGDLLVQVNMGKAKDVKDMDLSHGGVEKPVAVDMGNPHLVFFVDSLDDVEIETLGPHFENLDVFPNRTNVEFVEITGDNALRQRTWERGVGITEACGSGACAVAAAALHLKKAENKVEIMLDGGPMNIEITDDGDILMIGAVAYVFDGVLNG